MLSWFESHSHHHMSGWALAPTQLGDHSRRNKAKAKDEVSIYGQWLNMATKDSKTQSGPENSSHLRCSEPKLTVTTWVWQVCDRMQQVLRRGATNVNNGVQQMQTVQQMCAMDVNGVQQMRQQPWQVKQMRMATNARKQGVRKIGLGAWHVIDSVMKWQCRSARWGS